MKELYKQQTSQREKRQDRFVCIFAGGKEYEYTGNWQWELHSEAVFCSDVILSLPAQFEGTKGIIHPDDKGLVLERTAAQNNKEIPFLQFRIITTYGEVKTLTGTNLHAAEVDVSFYAGHDEQAQVKEEQEALDEVQRLSFQKRAGELAERLTGTGTWYLDADTHKMYYSDEVFRIYGLPRQSLNAHLNTFTRFIHPDEHDLLGDFFAKALKERVPLHLNFRIITPNGQEKLLHQATYWEYNDRGRAMLYGIVQDITEQNALEQRKQTAQYELSFANKVLQLNEQSALIAHWFVNLLTRKTQYSDNMYRLHGIKPGTISISSSIFLNYVHPEDLDVVQEVHKKILKQHVPPDIDFRIVRTDGKIRYMRQRGKLVVYGESEMVMIVTLQDVTAEMINGQKLADLKQQVSLRLAAQQQAEELAAMGSWLWEVETDKLTGSERLFEMLGLKPGTIELSQKHLVRAVHPEDRKLFNEAMHKTVQDNEEARFEFRMIRNGEIRQVRTLFRLMEFAGKVLFIGSLQDSTKMQQLRQDLKKEVQQSTSIVENVLDRIMITDSENTLRVWNKGCEETYGLRKEAVIGKNIFDVFPQLKNEEDISYFNRVLNGETVCVPYSKSNIRQEYHDLHMFPLKDAEGKVTGIVHLLHDVTKEWEIKQRFSERLNFIESLLEASVDRIIVMDRYMNYLYCNKKAADYFKLRKEDLIGKNVLEVFPASVNDPSNDHFRKALKGETVHIPAIEGFTEEHYYEVFLIPIQDEAGTVSAVLWMHHDLGSEIKIQRQLKKADELLNTINEAYVELDNNAVFRYVNHMAEEIWNITKEDVLGKNIWEVLPQHDSFGGYDIINKALEEKVRSGGEYFSVPAKQWLYMSAMPTDEGAVVLFYNISEIKETRKSLEEEHRRLKEAQAIGRIGSFEWNSGTKEVIWSDEMYRINGMEPQQEGITLEKGNKLIHPDDYEAFQQLRQQSVETPGFYQIVHRIIGKDGLTRYIHQRFQSTADKHGTIVRVHGTIQDITEQRKTEQELKEKVQFIESINGATADILFLMNLNTKEITYANRPVTAMLGYTEKQAIKMKSPYFDVMDSRDKEMMLQHIEGMKAAEDGEVREIEYRMVCADGSIQWYKDRNVVFERDSQKVPVSKIGISEDITERKGREDELFKTLSLLKQAEEVAGMGSWEYRIGEENMIWSEGMYQLFDLEQGAKVKPETYLNYVVKEDRLQADVFVKGVRQGAETLDKTLVIETKAGVRKVLKVKGIAVKDASGKPMRMLGVDLDITELMQTEEKLKALNHSLDLRNKELEIKNEELSNFSFVASHDLREPLRKIHTFSDWLLQRESGNLTEIGQEYLTRMCVSVARMDRLIEDVLVLTKVHAAAFAEDDIDLNTVLKNVQGELAETIRLTKTIITADPLPHISGNKDQLQQLFKNLISNAIKFQEPGNTPQLTIKSSNATAAEIVAHGLNIDKAYLKICFRDNGIGFEEKYTTKIFQIFQRLHARTEYDGTGIGLTICKKVMENHHGTISVESTRNKGSEFCCYFPV